MNRLNVINREICCCKHKLFSVYNRYKSYYHALGLDSTASAQDIKAAYYKLSLQYHPDKNQGSEESVVKFREITEAYETLSNVEKKKKYDQSYSFQPQYTSAYQTGNFSRARRSHNVHTGKTKDFDYDEHYKQHYENIRRQQEAEYEYFKRRWEAEFYRRYPTREEYLRNRHRPTYESPEQFSGRLRERNKGIFILGAFWLLLTLITLAKEFNNPDLISRPRTIYYHTSSHNEDKTDIPSSKEV